MNDIRYASRVLEKSQENTPMTTKKTHGDDCECDKPEILEKFKGKCSEEQTIKCHGHAALEKYKEDGKI